jgi:hypothetical protein
MEAAMRRLAGTPEAWFRRLSGLHEPESKPFGSEFVHRDSLGLGSVSWGGSMESIGGEKLPALAAAEKARWLAAGWRPKPVPEPPVPFSPAALLADAATLQAAGKSAPPAGPLPPQAIAAVRPTLHGWLHALGCEGRLADRWVEAGYTSVRKAAKADLSERDLKRLGVIGRPLRKRLLTALQQEAQLNDMRPPTPRKAGGFATEPRLGRMDLWRG